MAFVSPVISLAQSLAERVRNSGADARSRATALDGLAELVSKDGASAPANEAAELRKLLAATVFELASSARTGQPITLVVAAAAQLADFSAPWNEAAAQQLLHPSRSAEYRNAEWQLLNSLLNRARHYLGPDRGTSNDWWSKAAPEKPEAVQVNRESALRGLQLVAKTAKTHPVESVRNEAVKGLARHSDLSEARLSLQDLYVNGFDGRQKAFAYDALSPSTPSSAYVKKGLANAAPEVKQSALELAGKWKADPSIRQLLVELKGGADGALAQKAASLLG